jgi:uncharacterized protein YecT (DUF1311 family)
LAWLGQYTEAKMRRWIAALVLIAAACTAQPSQPAQAQQSQPSADVGACMRAAHTREAMIECKSDMAEACMREPGGDSTSGMIQCFGAESEAWDAQLDAALQRLESEEPTRNEYLSRANEAWLVWREAECRYRASENEGGSLAGVTSAACMSELTADRVIDLAAAGLTEN